MIFYKKKIIKLSLEETKMNCPHCGIQIEKLNSKNCTYCGNEIPQIINKPDAINSQSQISSTTDQKKFDSTSGIPSDTEFKKKSKKSSILYMFLSMISIALVLFSLILGYQTYRGNLLSIPLSQTMPLPEQPPFFLTNPSLILVGMVFIVFINFIGIIPGIISVNYYDKTENSKLANSSNNGGKILGMIGTVLNSVCLIMVLIYLISYLTL